MRSRHVSDVVLAMNDLKCEANTIGSPSRRNWVSRNSNDTEGHCVHILSRYDACISYEPLRLLFELVLEGLGLRSDFTESVVVCLSPIDQECQMQRLL